MPAARTAARVTFSKMKRIALLIPFVLGAAAWAQDVKNDYIRGTVHELNDNGAWSWFMDERAIVDRGQLLVGSVRANGKFRDAALPGWGNVELTALNLASGEKRVVVLHEKLE